MIEILHCGAKNKTLFKLANFATPADIKDTGPLGITVTAFNSVGVGSDANGTYINFTGGYLYAGNNKMDKPSVEINMVVGDIQPNVSGIYSNALLDTRPASTNGDQYMMLGITNERAAPYVPLVIVPAVNYNEQYVNTAPITTYPVAFKLIIKPSGTQLYMNGVLVHSQIQTLTTFTGRELKIARHGWSGAVPEARFKLYYFDIIEL